MAHNETSKTNVQSCIILVHTKMGIRVHNNHLLLHS